MPILLAGGYVTSTPDQLRTTLGGTIVEALPHPHCPNCGHSDQVTLISSFGGQIITAQWHCDGCRTHFEAVRL
jgi:hypothetical protein